MDLEAPLQKPEMETKWTTKLCIGHKNKIKWTEAKTKPWKSLSIQSFTAAWHMLMGSGVMLQHFKTLYFDETLPNVTDNAFKEESLQIWHAKNEGGSIWNINMFANLRQNTIAAKMHFLNFRLVISSSVCKIHLTI